MLIPALANLSDIGRLAWLELWGRVEPGTTQFAATHAIAYLERIGELSLTSHGQRKPKIWQDKYSYEEGQIDDV